MCDGRTRSQLLQRDLSSPCTEPYVASTSLTMLMTAQDLEICVPETSLSKAALNLNDPGLFESDELESFDNYNQYKHGCPRLRSTKWAHPSYTAVLLSSKRYGLDSIVKHVIHRRPIGYKGRI